jgi:NAD(P)-dependent dehydrogenase (short-subunit alcohol dehydrogenase family)/acyl carrier protein
MTDARTLAAIVEGVAELMGKAGVAVAAPAPKHNVREMLTRVVSVEPVAPAASSPAMETSSTSDLTTKLVQIVSERTGYPADMLDVKANLEADLGIDSIKRVEIIGAFRRLAVPGIEEAPAWFAEKMTDARTLAAIVEGIAELMGKTKGSVAPTPVAVEPKATEIQVQEMCPRCVGEVVEVPFTKAPVTKPLQGVLLLTNDGLGVADSVAKGLQEMGGKAVVIDTADLATRESTATAVERMRRVHGPITGLVHLLSVEDAPKFPGIESATWTRHVDREVRSVFHLLQAIAPELDRSDARHPTVVMCVSVGGGDFSGNIALEAVHPWRGGLAGIVKTAAKEWENAMFRWIDLDQKPDASLLLTLLREFAESEPVEVGYREGKRFTIRPLRQELPTVNPSRMTVSLNAKSVVLVTGGARGITAEVVHEIATHTQATFAILARSPLPDGGEDPATANIKDSVQLRRAIMDRMKQAGRVVAPKDVEIELRRLLGEREVRQNLARIRQTGSKVVYMPCDARDANALDAAVSRIRRELGPIEALIHGAGVIEDKLIRDKTDESFDRVVGTKLDPMLTLTAVLKPESLKLIMLFGSVAGFHGNRGQGDYAVANETLNRIARRLMNIWSCKTVCMNWGPWNGAGMVQPEVAEQFEAQGIGMVTVAAGRKAAWLELVHEGGEEVRVVIGPGPWSNEADRRAAQRRDVGLIELDRTGASSRSTSKSR